MSAFSAIKKILFGNILGIQEQVNAKHARLWVQTLGRSNALTVAKRITFILSTKSANALIAGTVRNKSNPNK